MKRTVGWLIGAAVLGIVCTLCGLPDPFVFLINDLGIGWVAFLIRVGQTVEWHPLGWFLAMAAFGLTALGVQQVASSKVNDWQWTRSLAAVALAVLASAASIALVGAIHETGWMITSKEPIVNSFVGGSGRRSQSANNLKQLGLAIHNYEEATGFLPTLAPTERGGALRLGWSTRIEPHLKSSIRPKEPGAREAPAPYVFENPGCLVDKASHRTDSHYAGNIRLLGRSIPTKLSDITDGTSNTLMAGEIESGFRHWRDPRNLRDPARGIRPGNDTFCGPWKPRRGTYFLMADGAVKFVPNTTDRNVLKALATPDGGESLSDDWEKWP